MADNIEALRRAYWEAFGEVPPMQFGLDDDSQAKLYAKALERGEPLTDDDEPDLPDGAVR